MKKLLFAISLCVIFLSSFHVADSAETASPQMTKKAAHLLNRATFGPRPDEINSLALKGDAALQAWIDSQLLPKTIFDAEVDKKLKNLKTLSMSNRQLAETYPRLGKKKKGKETKKMDSDEAPKKILIELAAQKYIRATESKRQLQEVLVDFWFNHFNVDFNKGQGKWLITTYERDAIRPNVFGKFSTLLKATAKNPAMLFYLDNSQSVKKGGMEISDKKKKGKAKANTIKINVPKGLNENYARELLELHTLGVDGGYTQKDVIEVARILTGWSIERKDDENKFLFRSSAHDTGAKTVMGVKYPAKGGQEEGEKLLEFLARHPATAKRISTKLAQRFISDNPPQSIIDKLSKTYLDTDGDLSAVYRELFKSPEFWSEKNMGSKIKKPFHLMASMIRALGGTVDTDSVKDFKKLDAPLNQMGEPIYRCQPPTGFKDEAEVWVNPGALVTRIQAAMALSHQRVDAVTYSPSFFRSRLRSANVMGSSKDSLKFLDRMLMGSSLREETIETIAQELEHEPKVQDEMEAKAESKAKSSVNLPQLLGLLLGSPEFQRY